MTDVEIITIVIAIFLLLVQRAMILTINRSIVSIILKISNAVISITSSLM